MYGLADKGAGSNLINIEYQQSVAERQSTLVLKFAYVKDLNHMYPFNVSKVEFPKGGTQLCPVEGCPGRAGTRTAMRVHFWRRHVRDTVIILEEGNLPHPRCEECDMLVPWRSLNGRHKDTEMCRSGAIKKRRREIETEIRESTERAFEAYGGQIEAVD